MELRELTMRTARIAIEAGRHALQDQINPHDLRNPVGADGGSRFASEIDERLIRYCRSKIVASDPCDGFWEEEGSDRKPGGRYWCLGHIDGSINYVRNMAEWTITVSLFEVGEDGLAKPILGVVHAPVLGLTYLAAQGQGAIRVRRTAVGDKREKIMPSTKRELKGSVVSFGMSYFPKESERALKTVAQMAGRPADIKRVGPTSLDLCRVADGSYDAYFEPMLHSWDIPAVSAGAVVVWQAQGRLSQWNGQPVSWEHNNDVVASNGLIDRELSRYLR
ncbi:inositol monophosphatase family protein [Bifidobacterium actinocoloniiforme DSM 22766]|uniref:Inositol monophosphatase family protein n=1 Tax=Bifidobacterium actinocoloniiforme DSM 22766 TaxID=1437605 RepID=A0A086Z182_9BIFI|nr:inositol monophosphatase family protein [Bifidobacterium actinocoloniiforme]AKV55446.1 inositol monophosphatase [Bifidobacterium actinocoloniiforme DSM 22766]KFI40282.1 inositol monophosphatase family protein [Bifidobacterium actinocoloniiforme DSM 22766]